MFGTMTVYSIFGSQGEIHSISPGMHHTWVTKDGFAHDRDSCSY